MATLSRLHADDVVITNRLDRHRDTSLWLQQNRVIVNTDQRRSNTMAVAQLYVELSTEIHALGKISSDVASARGR